MALAGLVGVGAVRILSRDPRAAGPLGRMGILLAAVAAGALLLLGWAQLLAFRDPFVPWQEDAGLLLSTDWGRHWRWALLGTGAAGVAYAIRPLRPVGFVLAPALALYPAFSGHAAASGDWSPLAMGADWLHVLSAGTWLGALAVLILVRPTPGGEGDAERRAPPLLVDHLSRFSRLARWSVALLVLTGGFASWLHLPGPSALWTHPYGRLLGLKLLLVLGLLALGGWNWRVLSPDAHTPRGGRRLVRAARLEVVLGLAVLAVTGWLTGTSPP